MRPSEGVGVPEVRGRIEGVRDEEYSGVYSDLPADNHGVRWDQTNPAGMQTG
jgi:hypothetical protein